MSDRIGHRMAMCFLVAVAASGSAARAAVEDPQAIARSVYEQVRDHFDVKLSNELVNRYFDTRSMAAQALGRPYGDLSSEQKSAYAQAFDVYFKRALFRFLNAHKGATFNDLSSRIDGDRATARCVLVPAHGQGIELAFRLLLEQDSWKASDVVVDNVSLIVSYRPQFQSLYKQAGFNGLVGYLNGQ